MVNSSPDTRRGCLVSTAFVFVEEFCTYRREGHRQRPPAEGAQQHDRFRGNARTMEVIQNSCKAFASRQDATPSARSSCVSLKTFYRGGVNYALSIEMLDGTRGQQYLPTRTSATQLIFVLPEVLLTNFLVRS